MCIRIFPAEATKEHMLEKLQNRVGAEKTLTFGSFQGRYDIYVEDADRDLMVKELKHRFEKISLRGWRNMLSWKDSGSKVTNSLLCVLVKL